jgi:WD40 repeat protein
MDAQLYVNNMSFSPKIPQPPAYIKVRAKFKKEKEFDRVFLAQELQSGSDKNSPPAVGSNPAPQSGSAATQNPIWAIEFSRDGKYLAAGGQDRIVRVWAVISSSEDRQAHGRSENDPPNLEGHAHNLSAPVFHQKHLREFHGHTATVLDLSWSKVRLTNMNILTHTRLICARTTFCSPHRWIRQCAYGMLAVTRTCVSSNTRILFHLYNSTPQMIASSSLDR